MAQGTRSNPGSAPVVPPQPSADPVGTAIHLLAQVVSVLAALLKSPGSLKKIVRVRAKVKPLVPQLLELASQKPVYAPLGSDPQALLTQWNLAISLAKLVPPLSGLLKQVQGTVLQLEADVWKVASVIETLASANAGSDGSVAELANQVKAALAVGPKLQRHVKAAIPPTPRTGKGARKALVAAAKAQAGLPESGNAPAGSPSAGAEPVPLPAPKPASDGGNGPVSGSAS